MYDNFRDFTEDAEFYAAGEGIPVKILEPDGDTVMPATFAADSWVLSIHGGWIIYCHERSVSPEVGQACEAGMIIAPSGGEYAATGTGARWYGPRATIERINVGIKGLKQ